MKPVVIVVSTATKTFTETAVGGEEHNRQSFFLQKIYASSRLGESLVQWAAAAIPAAFYPHIPLRRALTSAARGAAGESGGELSGGAGWTEWRIQHTALLHLLVPVASMQARELSQFLPMLLPSPSQN